MKIGNTDLANKVYLVAEVGNNHEGDFGLACAMIYMAAAAGVDAVKFQAITPEELISPHQAERVAQLTRYAFTVEQFNDLADLSKKVGIDFLCTPFSVSWVKPLSEFCAALKIASGDNNFFDLILAATKTDMPVIISTGLSAMDEVEAIVKTVTDAHNDIIMSDKLALLHCVSSYPATNSSLNLKSIESLQKFGLPVGYSDHSIGNLASLIAVGLGARIIEKHFTISKSYSDFRDHQLSADFNDMKDLARDIRSVEALRGSGIKTPDPIEVSNGVSIRRSICASRFLSIGKVIEESDLLMLRPGNGLAPNEKSMVVGKVMRHEKNLGDTILSTDVSES